MGKVSKNAKTNRGANQGESKNMVKVIKAVKSDKSGAYTFRERVVHKDKVQDLLSEK
ncbi:hypothetical protein BH09BAC1_BH09BAC1_29050 [soil metagenome]